MQGHIITLNDCFKFQRNSILSVLGKGFAHESLTSNANTRVST